MPTADIELEGGFKNFTNKKQKARRDPVTRRTADCCSTASLFMPRESDSALQKKSTNTDSDAETNFME